MVEIKVSDRINTKQIICSLDQWLATCSIIVWIIGVFIVSLLAMIHRSIDYTVFSIHPMIYPHAYRLSLSFSICAIIIYFRKNRSNSLRIDPIIAAFGIVAIWIFVSSFATGSYDYFFHAQEVRGESAVIQASYFVILFPSAAIITDETKKNWLLRIILLLSIVLIIAAFVLWRTQTTSEYFLDWQPSFTSIYANTNYYGYMLSMLVPLSAAQFVGERSSFWRLLSLSLLVLNTFALVITNTMGAWVACFFSMVFLIIARKIIDKKIHYNTIIVSVVFLVCFVFAAQASSSLHERFGSTLTQEDLKIASSYEIVINISANDNFENGPVRDNFYNLFKDISEIMSGSDNSDNAGSGRWSLWKNAIKYIGEYPLFGIGFEGVLARELWSSMRSPRPHNEYLQYALFYGIPAGIAFFTGCFLVFLRAIKQKSTISTATLSALTGAFGYLVSASFGISLFYITPFMFMLLGMGCARKLPIPT